MLPLLLTVTLGQLSPVLVFSTEARSVEVLSAAGTVHAFDGGFLVAWADELRAEGLSEGPTLTRTPTPDVWLTSLDLAGVARPPTLICPSGRVGAGPKLAVSRTTGAAALVWSERGGDTRVLQLDAMGRLDAAQPCGLSVSSPFLVNELAVSAADTDFLVLMSAPNRLDLVEVSGPDAGAARSFLTGTISNLVAVEGLRTTFSAWRDQAGRVQLRNGVVPVAANEEANAFDLIVDGNRTVLAYVNDGGFFLNETGGGMPVNRPADSNQRPFGATIGPNRFAFVYAFDGGTRLSTNDSAAARMQPEVPGLPGGLAVNGSSGLALLRLGTGGLGKVLIVETDGGWAYKGAPETVSVARAIQRRPSLAWDAAAGGWVVVWEEASSPTAWSRRRAFVETSTTSPVVSSSLAVDLSWPRVMNQHDGGLLFFGFDEPMTKFGGLADGGGLSDVTAVVGVIQAAVAAPASGLLWTQGRPHNERIIPLASGTLPTQFNSQLTCATWFQGNFVVTRSARGEPATIARFADTATPTEGEPLVADLACVASRSTGATSELGLARFVVDLNQPSLKVDTFGRTSSSVMVDGAVRDLQMTGVDGRWVVVWSTDTTLSAGLFTDGEPPRVFELERTPITHRGPMALSGSPRAAAIAWPALNGHSVELRVRTLQVPPRPVTGLDAGLDAGAVDAGVDAGAVDAGVDGGVDGGVFDADGGPTSVFVPVCGCGASDGSALLVGLGLVLAARRMRRHG